MNIAIVTGASSGLGREYVREIIKLNLNLESIWLIARREERLKELSKEYPQIKFEIISMDMSNTSEFYKLENKLKEVKPTIKILINSVGIAEGGLFEKQDLNKMLEIIELNCKGATLITKICLPYIENGGTIIEVSSTSAFVPNVNLVVYCASKSYLYALCIGLREELKSRKINVCCVTPGMMMTEMNKNPTQAQKRLPKVNVQKAAAKSLNVALKGR